MEPFRILSLTAVGVGLSVALALPGSLLAQANDDLVAAATPEGVSLSAPLESAWEWLETAVRLDLADRWSVPEEQLVLEWGSRGTVELSEDGPSPELVGSGRGGYWVVRVEGTRGVVGVRLRAGVLRDVAVAARALQRGEHVRAEDIRLERRPVWGPADPVQQDPGRFVGWIAQRRIAEGDVLTSPAVVEPPVVRSGESVEVSWSNGAVRLSLMGRAIGSARTGERVGVRLETGKRVYGVATLQGSVRVSGPSQ